MSYETHADILAATKRVVELVRQGYRAYALGREVRYWR